MQKMFVLPIMVFLTATPIRASFPSLPTLPDVNTFMNPILRLVPFNGRLSFNDEVFKFGDSSIGSDVSSGPLEPTPAIILPPTIVQKSIAAPVETLPTAQVNLSPAGQFGSLPPIGRVMAGLDQLPATLSSHEQRNIQPISEGTVPNFGSLFRNTVPQSQDFRAFPPVSTEKETVQSNIPSLEKVLANNIPQNLVSNFKPDPTVRQSIHFNIPSMESVIANVMPDFPSNGSIFDTRGQTTDTFFIDVGPQSQVTVPEQMPQPVSNQMSNRMALPVTSTESPETTDLGTSSLNRPFPLSFNPETERPEPKAQDFQEMNPSFEKLLNEIRSQDFGPNNGPKVPDLVTLLGENGPSTQQIEPKVPK